MAVLLVGGLSALGVNWYRSAQEQPLRRAFVSADAAFVAYVESISAAETLADVTATNNQMEDAAGVLRAAATKAADYDTALGDLVTEAVSAQLAVVEATDPLSTVTTQNPGAWSDISADLQIAAEQLAATAPVLSTLEAATEPDAGTEMWQSLRTEVGESVTEGATDNLITLFGDLDRASETLELRQTATRALDAAQTINAVLPAFDAGTAEHVNLQRIHAIYDAMAELVGLDGDHLDTWAGIRTEVSKAVASQSANETLRGASTAATASIDRLVERARARLSTWRTRYNSASEDKRATLRALANYQDDMTRLLSRYQSLRVDLNEFYERVEDPADFITWEEAYSVLSEADWQRQMIRDEMAALNPPAGILDRHSTLVSVIDDAISAVRSGYQGLSQAQSCMFSCDYTEAPGYRRFSSESARIGGTFTDAESDWRAAVSAAAASAKRQKLPPRPRV